MLLQIKSVRLSVIGYRLKPHWSRPTDNHQLTTEHRLLITDYPLRVTSRWLLIVLMLSANSLKSQQLPLYSQWMISDYMLNPAIGGKMPYYEAKSVSRYQWSGIEDAPRTYMVTLDGPLKSKHIGLGGYVFSDVTGPTRRAGFYGSYAYHMKLSEKTKLSIGLSGGLLQYAVDGSKIKLHDAGVDNALNNTLQSALLPDAGFGVYFYDTDHKYAAGVSAPQLLQNKIKLYDENSATLSKLTTHVYITGGYRFDINDDIAAEPSTLVKLSQATSPQTDIGARAIWQKQVWLGGYFRTGDAVSAIAGYSFKDYISIGYSYDFTITNIGKYSTGSHEIVLGVKFK